MTRGVACIMCTGTDYATECANGQCAAEQLDMLGRSDVYDGQPVTSGQSFTMPPVTIRPGRHDRGWPRG